MNSRANFASNSSGAETVYCEPFLNAGLMCAAEISQTIATQLKKWILGRNLLVETDPAPNRSIQFYFFFSSHQIINVPDGLLGF